jgi:hypothetical protein
MLEPTSLGRICVGRGGFEVLPLLLLDMLIASLCLAVIVSDENKLIPL